MTYTCSDGVVYSSDSTCACTKNSDCNPGYYCDIPTCDDTTGYCFECSDDNYCTSQQVCGCDDNTYANALEATNNGVIIRDYGECPKCGNTGCKTGETCCPGCFNSVSCVKVPYGGACPVPKCSTKYY